MCDLTDYYSDGDVKWANLVNSMASFNGITETVLASMNLNTDYSEVLVNIVSNVEFRAPNLREICRHMRANTNDHAKISNPKYDQDGRLTGFQIEIVKK